MPWIKFDDDFLWSPIAVQSTLYKKGMTCLVTTPCSLEAIAKGAGKRVKRPDGNKDQEPKSIE